MWVGATHGEVCAFCVSLCDVVQLSAIFSIHMVFLAGDEAHKQMQNLHHDQTVS